MKAKLKYIYFFRRINMERFPLICKKEKKSGVRSGERRGEMQRLGGE